MNYLQPIFTEKAQCQDCYKCIRSCPVKAIKVEAHRAMVIPERCIWCGVCVRVCPVGAKQVRNDLDRAKRLLQTREKVVVSLAPSFITEFPGWSPEALVATLRKLGFWGVSETALGAEKVSAHLAQELSGDRGNGPSVHLSSACPTAVELVRKYHPGLAENLTQLSSPVLAHSRMLRAAFGEEVGIVFISPCVSKKLEADNSGDMLDLALTFRELRQWLGEAGLVRADDNVVAEAYSSAGEEPDGTPFLLGRPRDGALYPMDGGMVESLRSHAPPSNGSAAPPFRGMSFSGLEGINEALRGLDGSFTAPGQAGGTGLFLELLACEGGCINGPQSGTRPGATVCKRLAIDHYASEARQHPDDLHRSAHLERVGIHQPYAAAPVNEERIEEERITEALRTIGKRRVQDELNCGGCGYETCRSFAAALVNNVAETAMCVSHMRRLAMNKANAIVRTMPSGVVIVDEALRVIECNDRFVQILGGDLETVHQALPGLEGVNLARMVPELTEPFQLVIGAGASSPATENAPPLVRQLRISDKILNLTIFSIEPGHIAGALIQDITEPAVQREQIIAKTKEVIRKNLTTVQQIAYLLGENASESEVLLSSIIDSFGGAGENNDPGGK